MTNDRQLSDWPESFWNYWSERPRITLLMVALGIISGGTGFVIWIGLDFLSFWLFDREPLVGE